MKMNRADGSGRGKYDSVRCPACGGQDYDASDGLLSCSLCESKGVVNRETCKAYLRFIAELEHVNP